MKEQRYQEIVNSYPCDQGVCGKLKGEAMRVIEDYGRYHTDSEMSEEGIKVVLARKKEIDKISKLAEKLGDAVNGMDSKKVAEALYLGLCSQHRTLQAQSIKAILEMLKIYKDTSYDLRNRAAVVAAHVISQVVEDESLYIPLI